VEGRKAGRIKIAKRKVGRRGGCAHLSTMRPFSLPPSRPPAFPPFSLTPSATTRVSSHMVCRRHVAHSCEVVISFSQGEI